MILVAYDDPSIAKLIANSLHKEEGYTTESVFEADAIVEAVRRLRPEVLLIGDGFAYEPGTSGTSSFDVVAQIRRDPAIAELSVIMFCYWAKDHPRARSLGCTPLTDPVIRDEVLSTIRALLGTSDKEQ